MWHVETTSWFDIWFSGLDDHDRARVLAALMVLRARGPHLPLTKKE
ncbi:hypothetical protein L579_2737 [Pantoea sp. AS-PWVM4]|nr:hypothetical protein L579_2737 [Pantoea sp. AS-PWVM4]